MSFPTIPTVAAGRVLTANQLDTTGTRTFPSLTGLTKNAGDLLIAIIVAYQSSTTDAQFSSWGGGFTEFHDTGTSTTLAMGCAYKWSDGTETGTFSVTQAATITGDASMVLLSIPAAHPTSPPEAGSRVSGTTSAADPGSFDPSGWGTEDALWISVVGSGMTAIAGAWTATGTTAPTSYTDRVDTNASDTSTIGDCEAAVSFRQLNAGSTDVGTAGVDVSNARNSALVIAVRGPSVVTTTHTSDSIVLKATTKTHTIDASLMGSASRTQTTDAVLFKTFTKTHTSDVRLKGQHHYLQLPGITGHYASTPDAAWQDITDDIDIRADLMLDDWTPAADMSVAAKWSSTGAQRHFQFGVVGTTGKLRFTLAGINDCQSDSAPGFADGTQHQIRVVRNRGVTGSYAVDSCTFFTRASGTDLSDDTGWVQLGATAGDGGSAMNTGGTGVFTVGTSPGEPALLDGRVYDVWLSNVIDGTAIMSFDADDFHVGDSDTDTAVDGQGNTWTIHGAGSIIAAGDLQTTTHTTDAVIKKTSTQTHTTDARVLDDRMAIHSTDAVLILLVQTETVDHTTDAGLKKTSTSSHSTDGLVQKTLASIHSADLVVLKSSANVHSTDALTFQRHTAEHTVDAAVAAMRTYIHTTDTLVTAHQTLGHRTSAYLGEQIVKHLSSDRGIKDLESVERK